MINKYALIQNDNQVNGIFDDVRKETHIDDVLEYMAEDPSRPLKLIAIDHINFDLARHIKPTTGKYIMTYIDKDENQSIFDGYEVSFSDLFSDLDSVEKFWREVADEGLIINLYELRSVV